MPSDLSALPLTYERVGGTADDTWMRNPPRGFRALDRSAQIGSGAFEFDRAASSVLAWGIQRRSGYRVTDAQGAGLDRVRLGDSVRLRIPFGPGHVDALARVVAIVDELRRRGFAYGTLPGHPECGEESFVVEHRDDDSVWLTIRAFSRPAGRVWRLVSPVTRLAQEYYTRRYLRVLIPTP